MKLWLVVSFLICSFACFADLYQLYVEQPRIDKNPNQHRFADKTRDAIMAMPGVQERTEELVLKIKNMTLGEHAEKVMILAPLVTGEVEFSADEFRVFYNHFDNRGGVRYQVTF